MESLCLALSSVNNRGIGGLIEDMWRRVVLCSKARTQRMRALNLQVKFSIVSMPLSFCSFP